MKKRSVVVAIALALPAAAACVDLFHGTDFETLCTKNPPDPSCGPIDAAIETQASDADAGPPVHPDFCKWSAPQAEHAADLACAWLGACEGPINSSRFGTCVAAARLIYNCKADLGRRPRAAVDDYWSCLSQVKTCAEVDRCVFGGPAPPCTVVPAGSFTACAAPSVVVQCSAPGNGPATAVEPCVGGSRVCTAINTSVAECTGVERTSCAGAKCDGTGAVVCGVGSRANIDEGIDCAGVGGGLCVLSGGAAACTASSDALPCAADADASPRCEGSGAIMPTSSVCVVDRDVSISCIEIGQQCIPDSGSAALPEKACSKGALTPCTGPDTCIANEGAGIVKSCGGETEFRFDCAKEGFGACTVRDGYASCGKP